jgi:cell division protein FtsA
MAQKGEIIVGLDIGTTKVRAVVGELINNEIQIIGVGEENSTGIKKGAIVDITSTVTAIQRAVDAAEIMAACEISEVYTGISGQHIKGYSGSGVIITNSSEITKHDIDRVIEQATAQISSKAHLKKSEIIHVLPQEFIVNDQHGIQNPEGMAGGTLEVKIHIVSGPGTFIQNIVKCVDIAGLEIKKIVLESLASSSTVLTEEEKEHGVALIDIGGNSSDMSIFSGGNIKYTYVLPIAGQILTKDVAAVMNTPVHEAEMLKLNKGECISDNIDPEEIITIPSMGKKGNNETHRQILCEILEKRTEEILTMLHDEIYRSGMEYEIPSGIVLTGGTANMPGIVELAESIFNTPVRVGFPSNVSGLSDAVNRPDYSTAVGLVRFGAKDVFEFGNTRKSKNNFSKIFQQIIDWFK